MPKKKDTMTVPTAQPTEKPPTKRVFVEKTVTHVSTGDSDEDERAPVTFKKRKFGTKNVRQRLDDD